MPIRLLCEKGIPELAAVKTGTVEEHHDNCRKIGSALRACKIWELYPSHHRSCNKFHSVGSNCNCALGAVTARPTSFFNDKATTCLSKTSRERYFVSASAGSASLDTIGSLPRRSSSWTHSCPTARCLTRPTPALLTDSDGCCSSQGLGQHSGSPLPWCH